jgi:hypothetical protein
MECGHACFVMICVLNDSLAISNNGICLQHEHEPKATKSLVIYGDPKTLTIGGYTRNLKQTLCKWCRL